MTQLKWAYTDFLNGDVENRITNKVADKIMQIHNAIKWTQKNDAHKTPEMKRMAVLYDVYLKLM